MSESDAERDARERVQAVYTAVDRLTPEDLRLTTIPIRDKAGRERLIARLEDAASSGDRWILLGESRQWLRDALGARMLARYRPEAGAWGISAGGAVEDRVEVFFALEDTVSVAATQDLLDPGDAAELADPGRALLGLEPLGEPVLAPREAAPTWEPSPEDWSAAAGEGPAAVDPEEPMAGSRAVQRSVFGVLGVLGAFGVAGALLWGFTSGQVLFGIVGALAVGAVAFTFATWRSVRR